VVAELKENKMPKYDLVGVNSNAFSVLNYVCKALRREGLSHLVQEYQQKATLGDYDLLIVESIDYLEKANEKAVENGYEDEEDDI
jgi:hypothetical protein